ncbi:hypothetical protein BG74_02695 [Sodalis-like endosymbiont of Proechinophthirus fluctus]|nr:hypothetical protein BG74_02695 [Sodalis-like endosymbiont of Proechinophthirus fluctus]
MQELLFSKALSEASVVMLLSAVDSASSPAGDGKEADAGDKLGRSGIRSLGTGPARLPGPAVAIN